MSLFSTTLQIILERQPGARAAFADRAGIPNSTLHTYVHGTANPDIDALEKLCGALEDEDRAELVIAHLQDHIPPSARELVRVLNLIGLPRVQESAAPDYAEIKLPKKLREDFMFLMRRATTSHDTAEWISGTVDLLKGR